MKTKTIQFFAVVFAFFITNIASSSATQSSDLSYNIAEKPSWVIEKPYDPNGFKDEEHGNAPYLLYSRQVKLTDNDVGSYTQQIRRIGNVEGAESASQITIDFDPTFQKLTLHNVTVTRNGVKEKRLSNNSFKLYRVETDADRLIYNGTVTASTVLDDIRVGDIIDYSFSMNGRNPYFKGAIGKFQRLQYGVPIDRHYLRLIVPNDRSYQTRLYEGGPAPKTFEENNFKIFEWDFKQQDKLDVDENVPYWHAQYPYFQISDKANWADVGRWKPDLYGPANKISQDLQMAIDKIKADYTDPESRITATLKFVQREIRYLGIEIGEGGYIPRDPSKVYARRFGDCKDKTRLMVTMLDRMGIAANALLVHSDQRQGIEIYLPNLGAFDHVITHVKLGGKSYYLDPTKGEQLGELNTLEQPNYGKGVDVTSTSIGLIDINPKSALPFQLDTTELFGFDAETKTITLSVTTNHFGDKADSLLRWKDNKGVAAISKNYLDHYQKTYPTIKVKDPIKLETNVDKSLVTITESYEIIDAWQQDDDKEPNFDLSFDAYPTSISGNIPDINKKPRTLPLAIKHPIQIRHQLKFTLPKGWTVDTDSLNIENDSFYFSKAENKTGDIYTETYTYRTKQDHIAPENLQAIMKSIEKIDDVWGVTFTSGNQYQTAEQKLEGQLFSENQWLFIAVLTGIFYIAALIFGMVKAVGYDVSWRAEARFYPVALWKFTLLTTVSFGIYWIFWIYKNWHWLTTVQEENLSPFWRTLFYPIMIFSLFSHMSEQDNKGTRWFRFIAMPLATLILLANILDKVITRWEDAPLWLDALGIATIYLLIPAVIHVNKMNDYNGRAYINNSKLTWHSITFIAMTVPIAILAFIGLFMME